MPIPSVIFHERVANWSRQLRPRFQDWPIRWSETRSKTALIQAAARSTCPVLVIGLDRRPVQSLGDFDAALQVAPNALSILIDPFDRDEVASLARELGATMMFSGPVVPPEVERFLRRWLPIAKKSEETEGWSASIEPEPEAWEDPDLFRWTVQDEPNVDERV